MTTTDAPPAPAPKANPLGDVAAALADNEMKAADLLELVGERAVAVAWTGGYVEFGHRDFTVTGNPHESDYRRLSELHVESAESWTGPKTLQHCNLKTLLARGINIPDCGKYLRNRAADPGYKPVADVSPLAEITRAEAEAIVYLKCRLTDKGHQLLLAE